MELLLPFRRFAWLMNADQAKIVDKMVSAGVAEYMRNNLVAVMPAIVDSDMAAASSSSASEQIMLASAVLGETGGAQTKKQQEQSKLLEKKRSMLAALYR